MKMIFVIGALLATCAAQAAGVLNVDSLNAQLKKSGAGWTAKENPMSKLTPEEARRRMGLKREDPAVQFIIHRAHARTLPASIDWRNKGGENWVSPVLDQGNCGSCVAFASIATLETQYKISTGFSAFNIKLSPQNLFACGGGSCDFGWWPDSAAQFLMTTGVPDESCSPYLSGATGQDVSCESSCADSAKRSVHIASYSTPTMGSTDLESVKQALQSGPLVTTLSVYADFMSYGSGVYKHTTGDVLGGHAISIVGYDDAQRALIIRNSWGTEWGQSGFAYVSYDDISGIGDETWLFKMPSLNGAVSVENPVDYTYVNGMMSPKAHSTYGGTDKTVVSVYDSANTVRWTTQSAGADATGSFDTSMLPDGRYEIQARAFDKNGAGLGDSTRQIFYVANNKPTLAISFTGTNGTDLSKPLSDRIEVAVHATSSTVPMSSVEFHYRGADGVDHYRSAHTVLDGMSMGWRTNLGPNGDYEIWMVGRVKATTLETVVESTHVHVTTKN